MPSNELLILLSSLTDSLTLASFFLASTPHAHGKRDTGTALMRVGTKRKARRVVSVASWYLSPLASRVRCASYVCVCLYAREQEAAAAAAADAAS